MIMPISQSLPWIDPLDAASGLTQPYWILLYSGARTNYSGRYSYLACDLAEKIEGEDFAPLANKLGHSDTSLDNAWFGYLGYGLKNSLEHLPADTPSWLGLPGLCMMRFKTIYRFDHETRSIECHSTHPAILPAPVQAIAPIPAIAQLSSNMTRAAYLANAAHIIARIHAGELYQANLTRKFNGAFSQAPDAFSLFRTLCRISPAPYSAYLRLGDTHILSSSPELFLRADSAGHIMARPIKGTAPRDEDPTRDAALRDGLAASPKDRAENLMITDLMRNDLARSCEPGSVQVQRPFEVTTHAAIHHMSSEVTGQKRAGRSILETVAACFPPGSMTGAPKIKAMHLCSKLEQQARGVYSGALGWFGGDGSCELSVVIRTLLLRGDQFEFQVGGGIVADSTPRGEYEESLAKAQAIARALNLPMERLAAL